MSKERESVKVLRECIEVQEKKGADYQSAESTVRQADYYIYGVESIYDMMHTKMLRLKSLMDKAKSGKEPNFESLEDTAKDLINYCSFYVSYCRGEIDGQDSSKDMFNRRKPITVVASQRTIPSGEYTIKNSDIVNSEVDWKLYSPKVTSDSSK